MCGSCRSALWALANNRAEPQKDAGGQGGGRQGPGELSPGHHWAGQAGSRAETRSKTRKDPCWHKCALRPPHLTEPCG